MTPTDAARLGFWLGRMRGRQQEPTPEPTGRFLTVAECARHIGRSQKAVYHLVSAGEIPHIRQGRAIRFDRERLDSWMARHAKRGRMV